MQYANIDVSSIAPTHLVSLEHPQEDTSTEKNYCAICKTEVCIEDAKTHPSSVQDVVLLPCNHAHHYACLRNASIHNNAGSSSKECPVCRYKYHAFEVPVDDVYVHGFHTKKYTAGSGTSYPYSEVDWNLITEGAQLIVGPYAAKCKNQTVVFKKQTKCQATVELVNGQTVRFSKTNLFMTASMGVDSPSS